MIHVERMATVRIGLVLEVLSVRRLATVGRLTSVGKVATVGIVASVGRLVHGRVDTVKVWFVLEG